MLVQAKVVEKIIIFMQLPWLTSKQSYSIISNNNNKLEIIFKFTSEKEK